jgi:hypothetical protein
MFGAGVELGGGVGEGDGVRMCLHFLMDLCFAGVGC